MEIMQSGIHIENIAFDCHIGPSERERSMEQRIVVRLFLKIDLQAAAEADEFALTVDYRAIAESVISFGTKSCYKTLEALALGIGQCLLTEFTSVRGATVAIRKPGVPGRADRAWIAIKVNAAAPGG